MPRTALIALGLASVLPLSATAATFDITDAPGTVASSISGTIAGIGFTMTGFLVDDELTIADDAQVGFGDTGGFTGFGVAGRSGSIPGGISLTDSTPTTASDFTIDGIGIDLNEMLRITFDEEIDISALTFNLLDRRDDVAIRVDGGEILRFGFGGDISANAGGTFDVSSLSLFGKQLDIAAGYPNQMCTTTTPGGVCGGANDLFQLAGADVAPIPLPAGLPMLLAGLGLAGWVARRKAA